MMSNYKINYRRTCWVCFATEEDEPGSEWTCPCMCRGATKWVHQVCLQQWIDEKQRGSSSIDVSCPQCQYPYQILYPSASPFLVCYEYINRALSFSAPMILAGLTASSIYWISFTYGVTVAAVSLGKERSIAFFSSPEYSVLVLTLPLLPWAILGVKLIRLEVQALKIWYRFVFPALHSLAKRIPFLSSIAPDHNPQKRFVAAPVAVFPFLSRCIVGTFSLPVIASTIGWALSYLLKSQSSLRRTVLVSVKLHTVVVAITAPKKNNYSLAWR